MGDVMGGYEDGKGEMKMGRDGWVKVGDCV